MEEQKFYKLLSIVNHAANKIAIDVQYYNGKTLRKPTDIVGDDVRELIGEFDLTELSSEQADVLGMLRWDTEYTRLVPMNLFQLLPDDTQLECINGEIVSRGQCDDDTRSGCVAYFIRIAHE